MRVLDLLFITKDEPAARSTRSSCTGLEGGEAGALQASWAPEVRGAGAPRRTWSHLAAALEPGTVAAALVWENTGGAVRGRPSAASGGQLVASGRIPTQAILAAAEAAADAVPSEGA